MWARLRGWLQQHAPFIADTLRPGASAAAVVEAEAALGVKLPPALVAILRCAMAALLG
jgi:cell wall assembly regulator SMI1